MAIAAQFDPAYLAGKSFNVSEAEALVASAAASPPQIDPRTTEDCLVLDVVTPERVYNKAKSARGAPVLVWIHGGGYTGYEKTGFGLFNPAGLIKASQIKNSEGVVYVALNYRVCLLKFTRSYHHNDVYSLEHSVGWPGQLYSLMGQQMWDSTTSV